MSTETDERRPVLDLYILPLDVDVEGCTATILESVKMPVSGYQASIQIRCRDVTSNIFQIIYRDGKELAKKLALEVSKLKYALMIYGKEDLRRRGIVI